MKTGALTGWRAASQNSGLMASKRRRSAARFAEGIRSERRQNLSRCQARTLFGRSRQVRASRSVVSPRQPSDMPATAAAESQKRFGPKARVPSAASRV